MTIIFPPITLVWKTHKSHPNAKRTKVHTNFLVAVSITHPRPYNLDTKYPTQKHSEIFKKEQSETLCCAIPFAFISSAIFSQNTENHYILRHASTSRLWCFCRLNNSDFQTQNYEISAISNKGLSVVRAGTSVSILRD